MSAIDDKQALQLVVDRQIELILICPNGHEKNYYATKGDTESLHIRLSSNDAPAWLEQINLPDGLADSFKLYQVNLSSEPGDYIELSPTKPGTKVQ